MELILFSFKMWRIFVAFNFSFIPIFIYSDQYSFYFLSKMINTIFTKSWIKKKYL